MVDSVRTLIDTVVFHDTTRITDTLWVLQSHSAWRDALPLVGSFAAIAAALATAFLAYVFNKRLLRYNIAYGSYQRALVRLQFLKRTLEEVREASIDVGTFLEALGEAAKLKDVDQIKYAQDARSGWKLLSDRLHKAQTHMFRAKDAVEAEYYGHLPVFPRLREAISSYCFSLLTDGRHVTTLMVDLQLAQFKQEVFPLAESRAQLEQAKERVFACLRDFERWYFELQELLRLQVFAGLAKVKRRPTMRRGGDPDALHLTLDGFKTAKELGWYDPKLDPRLERTKEKS